MKETYPIPSRWCVKITRENSNILEEWRQMQPGVRLDLVSCEHENSYTKWLLSDQWNDSTYISYTSNLPCRGEYEEISLETFTQITGSSFENQKQVNHYEIY